MDVAAADAAVGDLDFDVGFFEGFRGEGFVGEGGFWVVRDPACECIGHCGIFVERYSIGPVREVGVVVWIEVRRCVLLLYVWKLETADVYIFAEVVQFHAVTFITYQLAILDQQYNTRKY